MMLQISLQYLVAFKNYNYLNLNVDFFQSEQVIRLRFGRFKVEHKNNFAHI